MDRLSPLHCAGRRGQLRSLSCWHIRGRLRRSVRAVPYAHVPAGRGGHQLPVVPRSRWRRFVRLSSLRHPIRRDQLRGVRCRYSFGCAYARRRLSLRFGYGCKGRMRGPTPRRACSAPPAPSRARRAPRAAHSVRSHGMICGLICGGSVGSSAAGLWAS